jgi:glucosamine--fructose-6-phosphate aminotransferase (isomerizing)
MSNSHEAGFHTRQEILSQPAVWSTALETLSTKAVMLRDFYRAGAYSSVYFTGCGSAYYAAMAAAAAFQEMTGVSGRALPASEVWLYPGAIPRRHGRALLVAFSRSGETTETLRACDAFRDHHAGDIVTLSCAPDRPLASMGDVNLLFPMAQEESIAQTRAFTTLYLGSLVMAAFWAEREDVWLEMQELPGVMERVLVEAGGLAHALGSDLSLDRFYFLGSGLRYGLACELSLKMKEMSLTHSEPFHFMEFRHGPKSMVTPTTLVMGLVSEANHAYDRAVLHDMAGMGANILAVGEHDGHVTLASGLPDLARSVLYVPVGQLVALARSLAKGLDPDRPNNLDAVVKLA